MYVVSVTKLSDAVLYAKISGEPSIFSTAYMKDWRRDKRTFCINKKNVARHILIPWKHMVKHIHFQSNNSSSTTIITHTRKEITTNHKAVRL